MGDLYASAVGSCVLQLKEVPPCPAECLGIISLFDLADGVDEAIIRAELGLFGEITSCELGSWPPAVVRFTTHEAALAAKKAGAPSFCKGIDTLYNSRSYDGSEDGGDNGRGWCCFEGAVSTELVMRLAMYPKAQEALSQLPPKVLALSSERPATAIEPTASDGTHVVQSAAAIENATFTGKGDKPIVVGLYKNYVEQIARALQNTLALSITGADDEQAASTLQELPPMPSPYLAASEPPRLLLKGKAASAKEAAEITSSTTTPIQYAVGQQLSVRQVSGEWVDANVVKSSADGSHDLSSASGSELTLTLHAWNHAPCELPLVHFEALRVWYVQSMKAEHSHIFDALSGRPLDVFEQCVPIGVTPEGEIKAAAKGSAAVKGGAGAKGVKGKVTKSDGSAGTAKPSEPMPPTSDLKNAEALAAWMLKLHEQLSTRLQSPAQVRRHLSGGRIVWADVELSRTHVVLLTGRPAAGKTALMSQVAMHVLTHSSEVIPIVIKVQRLQAALLAHRDEFAASWNWLDAHLRVAHRKTPQMYRMLSQALRARRAIILIDGLDEGGTLRNEIETHVAQVLAPQGHVMLVTSRPAGIDRDRFADFHRMNLIPLKQAQQEEAVMQRLGSKRGGLLLPYLRGRVPLDTETRMKVTANPLMLSLVISIFELRQGLEMPETVVELYEVAARAMLERGAAASTVPHLTELLQTIFFQAHLVKGRVIKDVQLDSAALALEAPAVLAQIQDEALRAPFGKKRKGDPAVGHLVEIAAGGNKGKRGVIISEDNSVVPFTISFRDGTIAKVRANAISTSGISEVAFLLQGFETAQTKQRMYEECSKLSTGLRSALAVMRSRIKEDKLPLLSLLTDAPLQMQSSHLSFQEYFAARALCCGTRIAGAPPWQWDEWWDNALRLGGEMGTEFCTGLRRAAGVEGEALNLCGKLGGNPATVGKVIAFLCASSTSVDISGNAGFGDEGKRALGEALLNTEATIKLECFTSDAFAVQPGQAALDLVPKTSKGRLGAPAVALLAGVLPCLSSVTTLNVSGNNLGDDDKRALGAVFQSSMHSFTCDNLNLQADATTLDLEKKDLEPGDAALIGGALGSFMGSLTKLLVGENKLGDSGTIILCDALRESTVSKVEELGLQANKISPEGVKAVAALCAGRSSFTSLDLSCNHFGPEGAKALAPSLIRASLTELNLSDTCLCGVWKEWNDDQHVSDHLLYKDKGIYNTEGINAIADALRAAGSLTRCDISSNMIGDDGMRTIGQALFSSTTSKLGALKCDAFDVPAGATSLDLSGRRINPFAATLLAGVLKFNALLTTVNLSSNRLCGVWTEDYWGEVVKGTYTAEGIKAFADALRVTDSLTKVLVGRNKLGDEGTIALCDALRESTVSKVEELDLSYNDIGPDGLASATLCAVHGSLMECNLRGNSLKDEDWCSIFDVLRDNPQNKIAKWDLRDQGINPTITKSLAAYVAVSCTLTSLDLVHNLLNAAAAKALAPGLAANNSLTSLSLLGNRELDDKSVLMLLKIKEEKPTLLTLCGLQPDQTKFIFRNKGLRPADAKLLASEIADHGSLTHLDVSGNMLDKEMQGYRQGTGVKLLRDAVKGREGFVLNDHDQY